MAQFCHIILIHFGSLISKRIQEAVEQSKNEIITYNEVKDYIAAHYEGVHVGTITAQIIICSVNHSSRVHYPENNKPRLSNGERDFLFNVGRGMVTLYNPEKHGEWCIIHSADGKPAVARLDENETVFTSMPKPTKVSAQPRHKPQNSDVLRPCEKELLHYLHVWDDLENYRLQESALDKLFFTTYPENSDIDDVLIKASSLNDFYSTNIFSIFTIAKHIVNLNIDERLSAGDERLVDEIATVVMENGKTKNFYSFATKYCSHHRPLNYPIYDSYVDKVLKYFRDVDGFFSFASDDLKDYVAFKNILLEFRKFYSLSAYTLKDIDKYLWQLGKEKFPKNYKKRNSKGE